MTIFQDKLLIKSYCDEAEAATLCLMSKGPKVCFVVCDNGFSQIFYNCSNVEEIFSWHN